MALSAFQERSLTKTKFRWRIAPAPCAETVELQNALRIDPLVARCLINRGINTPAIAQRFLNPRLKDLSDPFLLPDMELAVDRIFRAQSRGESIAIFGDYDVDGITSCALLHENLSALGCQIACYIPHRLDEGYGLSELGIANCLEAGNPTLLIAVDCGSSSAELVASLQGKGVDVIILDHHQIGTPRPKPHAFVNPKAGHSDSSTDLCSVGLAFKLCHALVKYGRERQFPAAMNHDIRKSLDLVALGTIADQVSITNENRTLVHAGLERLNSTERIGLKALFEVAQARMPVGVYEVGFQLAPRLNAAGRLESAQAALKLLLTSDAEEAAIIAHELDEQNRRRQTIERDIADAVIERVRASFEPARDFAIVEGCADWHIGVVGIVASRVLREFHRPTIILGGSGEQWRGSGRSIDGFDLAAGLRACTDLLARHGGHAMAAGLSMRPDAIDAFRTRLNELARGALTAEALLPCIKLDAEVRLSDVDVGVLNELQKIAPFGQGNSTVRFCARGLRLTGVPKRLGNEQQHAKFRVTDGVTNLDVVWWNCGDALLPSETFDLAFEPQLNEYQGRTSVQLKYLDWTHNSQV